MFYGEIFADFIELSLFLVGMYYVAVGVFSLFGRCEADEPDIEPLSFAVIIPAHNEERVIARAVSSILNADYPKEKINVYVIADNCTDNTAYIAERLRVNVIRKTAASSGKSAALQAAARHILNSGDVPECITVIDADNLVDSGYFRAMNRAVRRYSVVQGRIEAKNPEQNWLTAAYSVWGALETRLGRLAPHNIGLNVKLSGTGYCARSEVFRELMTLGECLAEDIEYTAYLALAGVRTGFANSAVVYDEKPAKLSSSLRQRVRWARGIVDAQGRYGLKLLMRVKITDFLSLYGDFLGVFTYAVFCVISIFATAGMLHDIQFPLCGFWANPISYAALNIYL